MKRCPTCNRDYSDDSLSFCLDDGSPLTPAGGSTYDQSATLIYNPGRPTDPTRPAGVSAAAGFQPPPNPSWTRQAPVYGPPPTSGKAIWWVLGIGGVLVVGGVAVALLIGIIGYSSLSGGSGNTNSGNNANTAGDRKNPVDTIKDDGRKLVLTEDFAEPKWHVGASAIGTTSYRAGMYQIEGIPERYFVIYAPSDEYRTDGNTTVKVTARSVTGTSTNRGYGVAVYGHVEDGQANDYAFLIITGEEPQFTVVMHRNGETSTIKDWSKSSLIRSGTTPNQLEVKIAKDQLSFYINGQFATSITNSANFTGGRVGLCLHDTYPVAYDDLEIYR